jgi:hypothetical protein
MKQILKDAASSLLVGLAPALGLFLALLQVSTSSNGGESPVVAVGAGSGWGDIKGSIIWGGDKIPERQPLDLKQNPDKAVCLKNGDLLDETWVVNPKNKGLRYTFVWLEAKDKEAKVPIHPSLQDIKDKKIIMDQPVCMFLPHAIGLREGQVLVAKNSARISHNFKWSGGMLNQGNNVLLPPNTEREIADLKAERAPVSIECNIHPWMRGWVRVFNHPYFAVTDENGAFEFKNAPAGDWQLVVWHGSGGWLGGKLGKNGYSISIKVGGGVELKPMVYTPPAN